MSQSSLIAETPDSRPLDESSPALQPIGRAWTTGLVWFVVIGVCIYGGAVAWTGSDQIGNALRRLSPWSLVLGTFAAWLSLAPRFVRWQCALRTLGHQVPIGFSVRVYVGGLALTSSPGKVGETMRSLFLRPFVPVSRSLGAFVADRMSDVVAVALLGSVAWRMAGTPHRILDAVAALGFALSLAAAFLVIRSRVAEPATSTKKSTRIIRRLSAPVIAWAGLWSPGRAAGFVAAGAVAYGAQATIFYSYAVSLATHVEYVQCVGIFATSALLGAASMIPAGLGAMEAAMVVQLHAYGVPLADAVVIAIASRISTLWGVILLGVAALLDLSRSSSSLKSARPIRGS